MTKKLNKENYLILFKKKKNKIVYIKQVETYREGQRLLEKHRFQFPSSWLYIDNIEGEWSAFQDIIKRKDVSIQNQLATLQMKISQENGAVEQRFVINCIILKIYILICLLKLK